MIREKNALTEKAEQQLRTRRGEALKIDNERSGIQEI
jgi:hypothetical protein